MLRKKREQIILEGKTYTILRVFGYGDSSAMYHVIDPDGQMYILKEFADAASYEEEAVSLQLLEKLNVPMPVTICSDLNQCMILRENLKGENLHTLVLRSEPIHQQIDQMRELAERIEKAGYCLDYFPTSYIVNEKKVFYIHSKITVLEEDLKFNNIRFL